jgi:hypothetical protein
VTQGKVQPADLGLVHNLRLVHKDDFPHHVFQRESESTGPQEMRSAHEGPFQPHNFQLGQ